MTYQIQIKSDLNEDFIQIIQSLKNIGLVENFRQADSLSLENSPLSESSLLKVLKEREKEIEDGNFLTQGELIKFLKLWRNFQSETLSFSTK